MTQYEKISFALIAILYAVAVYLVYPINPVVAWRLIVAIPVAILVALVCGTLAFMYEQKQRETTKGEDL